MRRTMRHPRDRPLQYNVALIIGSTWRNSLIACGITSATVKHASDTAVSEAPRTMPAGSLSPTRQNHHLASCRPKFALVLPSILLVLLVFRGLTIPSWDGTMSKEQNKSASPIPSSSSADTLTSNHQTATQQKLDRMTPALPTWMLDYVDFYHSQLDVSATTGEFSLKPDAKYLLWTCRLQSGRSKGSCGGIGDRLNGIVQGLYMAICTNRVFLVDWEYPDPLTALIPALLPWNFTSGNVPISQILNTIDNRQNQFLLDPSKIPDEIQDLELWSNLWLYEPIVRQTQCLRDYWDKHGGLDNSTQLYQTAFWTLFEWSPTIVQHTDDLKRRTGLSTLTSTTTSKSTDDGSLATVDPVRPYVAMHVRTGVGASWVDPARHAGEEDWRRFYQCARTIQQGIHDKCPPTARPSSRQQQPQHQQSLLDIYVASDSSDAKERLLAWDAVDCRQQTNNISTTTFRSAPHLEVFHIDRSQKKRMRDPAAADLDLWGELSTLTDAVCLVTSRSGFSNLPKWLSPQQPRCQVRFDYCSFENVTIALQALSNAGCPVYD
jgi:hypothetical protein